MRISKPHIFRRPLTRGSFKTFCTRRTTKIRFTFTLSLLLTLICTSLSAAQTPLKSRLETIAIRVSEGTDLGFDLSADGRSIVFDLLGQLWLVPAAGGNARPLTDAVRDRPGDLDPQFAPAG